MEEPTFTLTVTGAEANLIGRGLGKLPMEEVVSLTGKLQAQVAKQAADAQNATRKAEFDRIAALVATPVPKGKRSKPQAQVSEVPGLATAMASMMMQGAMNTSKPS